MQRERTEDARSRLNEEEARNAKEELQRKQTSEGRSRLDDEEAKKAAEEAKQAPKVDAPIASDRLRKMVQSKQPAKTFWLRDC